MSLIFPIPHSTRVSGPYTASAGQTDFAGTFPIQFDYDVAVTRKRAGVTTTLVLDTDYEVAGAGNAAGFTVMLTAGATALDEIEIIGLADLSRTTSVVQAGQFNSRQMDREFDRNRIIDQELRRDIDAFKGDGWLGSTLRVPEASVAALAMANERTNTVLTFDGLGVPQVLPLATFIKSSGGFDAKGPLAGRSAYDTQAVGFSYLALDVLPLSFYVRSGAAGTWTGPHIAFLRDAEDVPYNAPYAGSVPTNVEAKLAAGMVDIRDYGATLNGVADDLAALTAAKAVAEAATPVKTIYIPHGVMRLSASITINCPVVIHGVGKLDAGVVVTLAKQERLLISDFLRLYADGSNDWNTNAPAVPARHAAALQQAVNNLLLCDRYYTLDLCGLWLKIDRTVIVDDLAAGKPRKRIANGQIQAAAPFVSSQAGSPIFYLKFTAPVTRFEDCDFDHLTLICDGNSSGIQMESCYELRFSHIVVLDPIKFGFEELSVSAGGGNFYTHNYVTYGGASVEPSSRPDITGIICRQGDAKIFHNTICYTRQGLDLRDGVRYMVQGNHIYLGWETASGPYTGYATCIWLKMRSRAKIVGNYIDNGRVIIADDGVQTYYGDLIIIGNTFTHLRPSADFNFVLCEGRVGTALAVANFYCKHNEFFVGPTGNPDITEPFKVGNAGATVATPPNNLVVADNFYTGSIANKQASELKKSVVTDGVTTSYVIDLTNKFPFQYRLVNAQVTHLQDAGATVAVTLSPKKTTSYELTLVMSVARAGRLTVLASCNAGDA